MANDQDSGDSSSTKREFSEGPSMTEAIKRLVTAGVSAAFMTEESIRSFVSELKLPKETLHLLLHGAAKSKDELMNRVSREVVGMVSKIDFVKEVTRFLEDHKMRINAEVEFIRRDSATGKAQSSAASPAEASAQTAGQTFAQSSSPSSSQALGHSSESRGASGHDVSFEVRSSEQSKAT